MYLVPFIIKGLPEYQSDLAGLLEGAWIDPVEIELESTLGINIRPIRPIRPILIGCSVSTNVVKCSVLDIMCRVF